MSFYSKKNSGSTVKLTLRDRLFGRKGSSKKRDLGLENEGHSRASARPTRSLEGSGYLRYGLSEGADVYISTSIDDPFIDCDEPKPKKTGGRFLPKVFDEYVEPDRLFKNALPEVKFTVSDFEEKIVVRDEIKHNMTPQTAVTSSIEVETTEDINIINFVEEPLYDIDPIESEEFVISDDVEFICEVDIERLPVAPAHAERLPSATRVSKEVMSEVSEPVFVMALPSTSHYLELASPPVVLALSPSTQVLSVAAPAEMFLLPEASASDEEIEAALKGTEESANAIMALLPSGLYVEGFEPTADSVTFEEDVISVSANFPSQVAETSSCTEEILVDYADYVGYDFLPEVTDPVRREPRHCEPTISQMPEYIEIGNEVSGMMLLTIPELADDAFEFSDSLVIREQKIPEDGMEALGISIDNARNAVIENIDVEPMINEAFRVADALSRSLLEDDLEAELQETMDIEFKIGEAFRSVVSLSETLFEKDVKQNVPYTLTSDDKIEVSEMINSLIKTISKPEEASEEVLTEVFEELPEVEEVRIIRPRISFIFGNGAMTRSFY
ncbi:MAG TPA: hypothetical protein VJY42_00900 [Candidatus Methanomethylophilaceae archaeon]|nr:hypothetical protein [Candidatus Methanomethylophilaceae archaeon]